MLQGRPSIPHILSCLPRFRKRLEYRKENILPMIPIRVSVSCICSLPYGNTAFVIVVRQASFTFLSQSQCPDFGLLFSSVRVCAHGQFSFSACFDCHLYLRTSSATASCRAFSPRLPSASIIFPLRNTSSSPSCGLQFPVSLKHSGEESV